MRTVTDHVVVMDGCSDESFDRVRPIRVYLAGGLRSGWQDKWINDHPGEEFFDPRTVNDGRNMAQVWAEEQQALRWCDEVYAYLEADNPSGIGLAFECGYARALGKRVVLVDEKRIEWLAAACGRIAAQASLPTGTDTTQVVPAREDVAEAREGLEACLVLAARSGRISDEAKRHLDTLTHAAQHHETCTESVTREDVREAKEAAQSLVGRAMKSGRYLGDGTSEYNRESEAYARVIVETLDALARAAQTPPEVVEAWERYSEAGADEYAAHLKGVMRDFATIDRHIRGER